MGVGDRVHVGSAKHYFCQSVLCSRKRGPPPPPPPQAPAAQIHPLPPLDEIASNARNMPSVNRVRMCRRSDGESRGMGMGNRALQEPPQARI